MDKMNKQADWEEKLPSTLKGAKTCPVCGKEMFRMNWTEYHWKLRTPESKGQYVYYCSYKCMRVVEKPLCDAFKAEMEARDLLHTPKRYHKKP